MKWYLVLGTVVALLLMAFAGGCAGKKTATESTPATGGAAQTATPQDAMRTWIASFNAADAKTLEDTGRLVLSYTQLQTSDPEHARLVADYVEEQRLGIVRQYEKAGRPVKPVHASPYVIDALEFVKSAPDTYTVKITTVGGPTSINMSIPPAK